MKNSSFCINTNHSLNIVLLSCYRFNMWYWSYCWQRPTETADRYGILWIKS